MKATSAILITTLAAAVLIGCDKKEPAAPNADAPKNEAPKSGADAKTAAKPYPLDVCLVSGEKLGSMGAPVVYVHEGQEIKFCCKSCLPDFKKEPAKFLVKLAPKK
jgi:YHS domain-containing protein